MILHFGTKNKPQPKITQPVPSLTQKQIITLRANELANFSWKPIEPTYPKWGSTYFATELQRGIPYSSTRGIGRTIGRDISFYTFLTALKNPLSRVYTEDLRTQDGDYYVNADTAAGFYGMVCSEFLAHVYDLDIVPASIQFTTYPGAEVRAIQSANAVEVGDFLYRPGHVALVSDVNRAYGTIQSITVAEATSPVVKLTTYSPAEFNNSLRTDTLYSFDLPHELTFTPFEYPANYNSFIGLDRGDKTNYVKDKEPVRFNIMDERVDKLTITKDGITIETILVASPGVVERTYSESGLYKAYCTLNDSSITDSVEFMVASVVNDTQPSAITLGQSVTVNFSAEGCEPSYIMVRDAPPVYGYADFLPHLLTETEKSQGYAEIRPTTTGKFVTSVVGKNEFGHVYSNLETLIVNE